MTKLFRILVTVSMWISVTQQFTLICNFERGGWDDVVKSPYSCKVESLNVTRPKTIITDLRGQRLMGENVDKVNAFLIYEQICEFFPVGVEHVLKGLEGIAVQKSGLKIITKYDLKPFGNLKSISLYGNRLTSLESNLFVFNPQLKQIAIHGNKLLHVFTNFFDGLNQLEKIYLSRNPCIN